MNTFGFTITRVSSLPDQQLIEGAPDSVHAEPPQKNRQKPQKQKSLVMDFEAKTRRKVHTDDDGGAGHIGQPISTCKPLVEDVLRSLEQKNYTPIEDLCQQLISVLPFGKVPPDTDLAKLDSMGISLWNSSLGMQSVEGLDPIIIALCTFIRASTNPTSKGRWVSFDSRWQ
jgi:hypothetical protein